MCSGRSRVFRLFVLTVLFCAVVTVGVAGVPQGGLEGKASLVFVTQSDACDCVANLCVAGEQEVLNFLDKNGAELRYQRVDLKEDPAAGRKYRAVTLPVVLLFDVGGQEIARFDSFFTEAQLTKVWQQFLASKKGQP